MTDEIYKATIQYAGDEFFIATSPSGHAQTIDTKADRKSAPTPMEMLLTAVGACTAVDVVSILEKKRQIVTDYKIEVTATRRAEHPRSYDKIHIRHIVYGEDVAPQMVEQAIKLSDEKYCSVAATLRPAAEITTSFEIINGERQTASGDE